MKIYTKEQLDKAYEDAPASTQEMLFSPAIETQVQKAGATVAILTDGVKMLNSLTNLAILRLLDEKEFTEELTAQLKIDSIVAQKIASDIFSQIISPIRLKENEETKNSEVKIAPKGEVEEEQVGETGVTETVEIPAPTRTLEKMLDVAPDNLPIAEPPEYLTPPIPSKSANLEVEPPSEHPFEEKMKRVFTAGQQSMGELTLEPAAPATPAPARLAHDPYREAIE